MSLFDRIFRPKEANKSDNALNKGVSFVELNNYRPVFTDWKGEIYESELIRAAIDARARHISKLKVELKGTAQPQLQNKMRSGPNQWQTYSQFLYRLSTILDIHNTAFVVPVFDAGMVITGYYPVLPKKCDVVEYMGEMWLRYKFSHGQTAAVELRKCAVLNKFQYKDDFFGTENDSLDETLTLIDTQNESIKEGAKNAATYRFMAQVNNFTKADDLKNERVRFSQENLTNDAEAGGLLLFPNTYQNIQQIKTGSFAVDPEQTKLINDNVYKYFGVNEKIMRNEATSDELDKELAEIYDEYQQIHDLTVRTLEDYNAYRSAQYLMQASGIQVEETLPDLLYYAVSGILSVGLGVVCVLFLELKREKMI